MFWLQRSKFTCPYFCDAGELKYDDKCLKEYELSTEDALRVEITGPLRGGGNQLEYNPPQEDLKIRYYTGNQQIQPNQQRKLSFNEAMVDLANYIPMMIVNQAKVKAGQYASKFIEQLKSVCLPKLQKILDNIEVGKKEAIDEYKKRMGALSVYEQGTFQYLQQKAGIESFWNTCVNVFKQKTLEITDVMNEVQRII